MTTAPARSASMASTASSSSVGWLDVRAVAGIRAIRHPPLAEQAQHVVDAQAAAMRHRRPDGVDERPVAGQPQPAGTNGGSPQRWPAGLKTSGGAPRLAAPSMSCHTQASKPPGSKPIGRSSISRSSPPAAAS